MPPGIWYFLSACSQGYVMIVVQQMLRSIKIAAASLV